MIFIIQFRPGSAWLEGKSVFEQPLEAHGAYMQQLYDADKLILGGPLLDDKGGTAIIEVDSEEEARRILSECPSVAQRIFSAELHPLQMVFDRSRGVSLHNYGDI